MKKTETQRERTNPCKFNQHRENCKFELNYDYIFEKINSHLIKMCYLSVYFSLKFTVAELLKIHTVVYCVELALNPVGVQ